MKRKIAMFLCERQNGLKITTSSWCHLTDSNITKNIHPAVSSNHYVLAVLFKRRKTFQSLMANYMKCKQN